MKLVADYLEQKITFGIETNLADLDTWKFLLDVQQQGYSIHLLFMFTDDIDLLNRRIEERSLRGEHFVRPDIVRERYVTAFKLLKHYFLKPDKIQLFDNSDELLMVGESNGQVLKQYPPVPDWAIQLMSNAIGEGGAGVSQPLPQSIEAVRQHYQNLRKSK